MNVVNCDEKDDQDQDEILGLRDSSWDCHRDCVTRYWRRLLWYIDTLATLLAIWYTYMWCNIYVGMWYVGSFRSRLGLYLAIWYDATVIWTLPRSTMLRKICSSLCHISSYSTYTSQLATCMYNMSLIKSYIFIYMVSNKKHIIASPFTF